MSSSASVFSPRPVQVTPGPLALMRRRAALASDPGQRLGGAADLTTVRLPLPERFAAEPVAAGLTAPVGVAAASDGLLYVVESGHPRRTPPRLLRLDPLTGVASVVASFETLAAPAFLTVACAGDAVYLASAGVRWRLDQPPAGPVGLFAGATLGRDALYLCDAGHPAGAPGAGLLWRVAPVDPSDDVHTLPSPGVAVQLHQRRTVAALAAGCTVAIVAIGLAWYYRERRSPRRWPAT